MSEACWVGTVIGLGVARATVVQSMAISSVITCHAVLNAQSLHLILQLSPFICCERNG